MLGLTRPVELIGALCNGVTGDLVIITGGDTLVVPSLDRYSLHDLITMVGDLRRREIADAVPRALSRRRGR
ncbi:hypothetical protein GCM10029978_057200 [Actinoallomurus acanthiterrae]